jgi:citrate synthase
MYLSEANAGLRGVSAGETAIATVGKEGTGLTYRGYDITELALKKSPIYYYMVIYLIQGILNDIKPK